MRSVSPRTKKEEGSPTCYSPELDGEGGQGVPQMKWLDGKQEVHNEALM